MVLMTFRLPETSLVLIALAFLACERKGDESEQLQVTGWQLVGSQVCADCHQDTYNDFMQTGMGRSFGAVNPERLPKAMKFGKTVYDAKRDFYYSASLRNGKMVMREFRLRGNEVAYEQERSAAFQIGSSNHTVSFVENHSGYLFEMPLTWYSKKQLWDLSPGYRENNQRFDRPINSTCINCHNAPMPVTKQTENHYERVEQGISCETCHGPGSYHVEAGRKGRFKTVNVQQTIKNTARESREIQMDMCQRCHLEGFSVWNDGVEPSMVSPGSRLHSYKAVFVGTNTRGQESDFRIAAQADRLKESKCFQKSGSMVCTTCHDPHQNSKQIGTAVFNQKCQSCHGAEKHQMVCSLKNKKADVANNCTSCHMRTGETSDIPHVLFTDHYIRKNIEAGRKSNRKEPEGVMSFVPVIESEAYADRLRQRGLMFFEYYQSQVAELAYLDSTILYLQTAAALGSPRFDGQDEYALGGALYGKGSFARAIPVLQRAVVRNPSHARAYFLLGRSFLAMERLQDASRAFGRGMQAQPRFVENYLGMSESLILAEQYDQAIIYAERALVLDSLSYAEAFYRKGLAHHNKKNLVQARELYERALQLDPDYASALLNEGATFMLESKWKQAVPYLERIIRRYPESVPALFNKAVCLVNLRDSIGARAVIRRVLEIEPDNEAAKEMLRGITMQ